MTTHRLTDLVSPKSLRITTPETYINPKTYQLNDRQTLFLGGVCRFDYVEGEHQGFTVYAANQLDVHRTKLENADNLYERHLGTLLVPPLEEDSDLLRKLYVHSFTIKSGHPQDIVISGVGWVTLRGQHPAQVKVHVPKGVDVHLRRALI